jgi:hypothetical protein
MGLSALSAGLIGSLQKKGLNAVFRRPLFGYLVVVTLLIWLSTAQAASIVYTDYSSSPVVADTGLSASTIATTQSLWVDTNAEATTSSPGGIVLLKRRKK